MTRWRHRSSELDRNKNIGVPSGHLVARVNASLVSLSPVRVCENVLPRGALTTQTVLVISPEAGSDGSEELPQDELRITLRESGVHVKRRASDQYEIT